MSKTTAAAIMITFLAVSVFGFLFVFVPANGARTITVPDEYPSIQGGVNAASAGDTVYVRSGIYYEHVVLDKSLMLRGESWETTVIDGQGTGNVTLVTTDNVAITGFTMRNSSGSGWGSDGAGVALDGVENCNVTGNRMISNGHGVIVVYSSRNDIFANIAMNNSGCGIVLHKSSYNRIFGNNVTANDSVGIHLEVSSSNNVVSGNEIWGNKDGVELIEYANYNVVSGNSISRNDEFGILLQSSSSNRISANEIVSHMTGRWWYGRRAAIFLFSSSANVVCENSVLNNSIGLGVDRSSTNKIFHNSFKDNVQNAFDESWVSQFTYASNNKWDNGYPSGGNYWSNYTGVDVKTGAYQNETGSDGIGDTAHVLDPNNRDQYPLMSSWTRSARVEAGDWIRYSYTVSGAPSGTQVPAWLRVDFLSVDGATANVKVILHMLDGTEQSQTLTVDLTTGGAVLGFFSGFVIPFNCSAGDCVLISGYGKVLIDGEESRTYAGASRTVVYSSLYQQGGQLVYYWDKQTGVIVEASTTSGSIAVTGKATETNMWEAVSSPFWMQWWFYAVVGVVIVALGGVVYFLRKRKPPTSTAPPLSTEST